MIDIVLLVACLAHHWRPAGPRWHLPNEPAKTRRPSYQDDSLEDKEDKLAGCRWKSGELLVSREQHLDFSMR
jgi:hypothetical protein